MSPRSQILRALSVQTDPRPLVAPQSVDISTQTIDLNSLYNENMAAAGTFNLSGIESTSLGKLLHVLPVPAMVVDSWYSVVFANQACTKLGAGFKTGECSSFPDLLSFPEDPDLARNLRNRALALLERAFLTRKPEVAEAILEVDVVRVWARLHLRSVKIASKRYVLVIIEDVTAEKTQSKLNQREGQRLRQIHEKLSDELRDLRAKLQEKEEKLRMVSALYSECREQLSVYEDKG